MTAIFVISGTDSRGAKEIRPVTTTNQVVKDVAVQEYKYGFVTDVEEEVAPKGLNEDVVRFISAKKNEPEWMLEWRLKAYNYFLSLLDKEQMPDWANIKYPPVDFQDIIYYAAPKASEKLESLDEVDPEILKTYEKLGIPLQEAEATGRRGSGRCFRQRVHRHYL